MDSPLDWPSDHCLAWIQIAKESVLGDYLAKTKKNDMVEFQCADPQQRERYQQICCQGCATHQITKKIKAFYQLGIRFLLGETKFLPEIIFCYNQIHTVTDPIWKGVVKGLQKKRVGGDPWTPMLQDTIDQVDYWSHVVKHTGVATSANEIKKLAKKLYIKLDTVLSPAAAKGKLKKAQENQKKAKEYAPEWRDRFS